MQHGTGAACHRPQAAPPQAQAGGSGRGTDLRPYRALSRSDGRPWPSPSLRLYKCKPRIRLFGKSANEKHEYLQKCHKKRVFIDK